MTLKLIECSAWKDFADHIYDAPDFLLPERDSCVWCPVDHIEKFFRENTRNCVVISSNSDFGVCLQKENPVWQDMRKWQDFIPIDEQLGYNPLISPARCNLQNCKTSDKYSCKCYSFTTSTFPEIPSNILHWYCTNCDIEDDRVTAIPFGCPNWSAGIIRRKIDSGTIKNENRKIGYYVNFQNTTSERAHLKRQLRSINTCKVIDGEIPHEEYIDNLIDSFYVISASSNGLDCYRTLESLYCNAVPIITRGAWNKAYEGLSVISVDSYATAFNNPFTVQEMSLEGTRADMNYWANKFAEDRKYWNLDK